MANLFVSDKTFAITYLHATSLLSSSSSFSSCPPTLSHVPQDNIRSMVSNDNDLQGTVYSPHMSPPHCLGLQRKASLTGLNWSLRSCSVHGGYVCKRPKATARQSVMQNQTVVGSEGRLTSPGFPNAYPPNVDYSVKISGPERSRLIVQFQRLDVEFQDECMYDYVSVRDFKVGADDDDEKRFDPGTNAVPLAMFRGDVIAREMDSWPIVNRMAEHSSVLAKRKKRHMMDYVKGRGRRPGGSGSPSFQPYVRWCGEFEANMSRFDFISRGNQALLHFHSDYAGSGAGFAANWAAVDITGCPSQTLTSREGVIQSPNHPYFLLHHLECTYTVQAPLGRKVWIEFIDFDIREDALVMVDLGDGGGEMQPFAHTRVHTDGAYMSHGEKMRITLRTGARPEGRGFKLAFRTVGEWRFLTLLFYFFSVDERGGLLINSDGGIYCRSITFTPHPVFRLMKACVRDSQGIGFSVAARYRGKTIPDKIPGTQYYTG